MADNTNLLLEKNSLSSVTPWILGMHIDNPGVAAVGYDYIVSDVEDFVWNKGKSDGTSPTFVPFPFVIPTVNLTSSSKFSTLKVNAFNHGEVVKVIEESAATLIGAPVTLFFINKNAINDGATENFYSIDTYPIKFKFTLNNIHISQSLTLELGGPNYLLKLLPTKRYYKKFCDTNFMGEYCWMKDFKGDPRITSSTICGRTWDDCCDFWHTMEEPTSGVSFQGFPMLTDGSIRYY